MSITPKNYKDLKISADNLFLQVSQINDIKPSEAIYFTSDLLEKRKLLDQIIKEDLFSRASETLFHSLMDSTKKLNKTQSQLIKRLHPTPVFSQSFTQRIEKNWIRATGQNVPSDDFGYHYSNTNRKDPIVLETLHEHLRIEALLDFKLAYKIRDKQSILELLKNLHPDDRQFLENEGFRQAGHKKAKWQSGRELLLANIQGQWDPRFIEIIDSYIQSDRISNHVPTFPIVHQVISPEEHESLIGLYTTPKFVAKLLEKINERTTPKYTDNETVRDLLYRNINNPIIQEVNAALVTESELWPLKNALEGKDWYSAARFTRKLSLSAKQILQQKYLLIEETLRTKPKVENYLMSCILGKNVPKVAIQMITRAINHFIDTELERRQASLSDPIIGLNVPFIGITTIYDANDPHLQTYLPNLKLAFAAVEYTLRKIPISSNFTNHEERILDPRSMDYVEMTKVSDIICSWKKIRDASATNYQKQKKMLDDPFSEVIASAKTALIYPFGNCESMVELAFSFLVQNNDQDQLIEIFFIEGKTDSTDGDHVIGLIGRDANSDKKDPTTWGPKAVVFDPWARKTYPASLINNVLQDYIDVMETGFPRLKKFNPTTQNLKTITENLTSKDLFKLHKNAEGMHLHALLNEFYKAISQDQKQKIAGQILDYLEALKHLQNKHPYSLLKAQMHFYVHKKLPIQIESSDDQLVSVEDQKTGTINSISEIIFSFN